tara:strand:- start:101 stop:379 length:279 start_codon:yes stop_codon:yes gene_type:complete
VAAGTPRSTVKLVLGPKGFQRAVLVGGKVLGMVTEASLSVPARDPLTLTLKIAMPEVVTVDDEASFNALIRKTDPEGLAKIVASRGEYAEWP